MKTKFSWSPFQRVLIRFLFSINKIEDDLWFNFKFVLIEVPSVLQFMTCNDLSSTVAMWFLGISWQTGARASRGLQWFWMQARCFKLRNNLAITIYKDNVYTKRQIISMIEALHSHSDSLPGFGIHPCMRQFAKNCRKSREMADNGSNMVARPTNYLC
jgi:hypothetical protein